MLKPGMMLCDRYEIIDTVGAGGMSIVYKAKCHRLNRYVAIKVLKPEFSNDANFVAKFRVEAQASAGLTHQNIVSVFDVCDDNGLYFIVMELVEGITLKEYITENGRLPMDKALDFSIQIASGLEVAHENHIIHRDIKPQNIIVSKNGSTIKVTDFGIAKAATPNTLTSGPMGSVHYISPEQARGGYSDERSDIYSLGITMYEMVTGRVPYEGENNVSVALMHIQNEMIKPTEYYPDIYSSFEKIIFKATNKKPEKRYLTASALIADLKRVQNNPRIDIIVAANSVTNSPTQEWTAEEVKAIREQSSHKPIDPEFNPIPREHEEYDENYDDGYDENYDGDGYDENYDDNYDENYDENYEDENYDDYPEEDYEEPPVIPKRPTRQRKYQSDQAAVASARSRIDDIINDDPYEDAFDYEEPVRKRPAKSIKRVDDYEDDYDYVDDRYEDDDEIDPTLKKAVVIGGIAAAVIVAIILIIVIGKVMGVSLLPSKSKSTTEVEDSETEEKLIFVENVCGLEEKAAINTLIKAGFEEEDITVVYENNENEPEGYVFEQDIEPREEVKPGTKITIKVSSGAELVKVPSVKGYEEDKARKLIEEAGFKVQTAYEFDDDVKKDFAVGTDPESGSEAPKGSTVKLIISNGKEEVEVTIPNLSNLTEADAKNSLTSNNLEVGTVTKEHSDTVPAGKVISQNPAANSKGIEGDKVSFVISEGPEPKEVTYKHSGSMPVTIDVSAIPAGTRLTLEVSYGGIVVNTGNIDVTEENVAAGSVSVTATFSKGGYSTKDNLGMEVKVLNGNAVIVDVNSGSSVSMSEE